MKKTHLKVWNLFLTYELREQIEPYFNYLIMPHHVWTNSGYSDKDISVES